jgi:uncharacterized protein (TIRG00374 family)
MKKSRSLILGTTITILCLWLSFRHVRWSELVDYLQVASYPLVAAASLIYLLSYAVRAFLWSELLGTSVRLGPLRLFEHLMLGVMANNILPARMGELVRCHLAAGDAHVARTRVFSSIFVERSLDVLCLFALTMLAFAQDFGAVWPSRIALLALLLILLILGFILAVVSAGQAVPRLVGRMLPRSCREKVAGRLAELIAAFRGGLPPLRLDLRNMKIMAYALGCWVVWAGFLYAGLAAFAIQIPLVGVFMLTGIINLGVLAPSSPGFIGPFQFICLQGLALYGVAPEKALAFSLVFHASWYLPSTILGAFFGLQMGLSRKQIKSMTQSAA